MTGTPRCAQLFLLTLALSFAVICLNGGSWTGGVCRCPNGFSGDRCQNHVPIVNCQNGGTWDGLKCQCTSLFQGPRCEEVVESFETESIVTATVEVTVRVTSQNFSEKLNDQESKEFKDFNKTFSEQMAIIYEKIPEYGGVVIKELRSGSIIVDYDVILKTQYTPDYEDVLQEIKSNVQEKIINATEVQVSANNNCTGYLLCFDARDTEVQDISGIITPEEECRRQAGEEYKQYVLAEQKGEKWLCYTACSAGYNASLDCHYGKCQLQRSGPRCLCLTTDTHWYSGETCDWGIQKSLVYGLVGAGVAVLLVVLIILAVFSFHYRGKAQREHSRVTQMQKWNEEEGRTPGAFHNIGFDHNEEREDYINLGSVYSNFDALRNINPEEKIQIQRPQVVMTSL
uniref:mucin-17 n=1 Tax=Myodes glareolus TaxID=447135 RepID=UPI0020201E4F|nr:mucin-17 [Myodes glareolus]